MVCGPYFFACDTPSKRYINLRILKEIILQIGADDRTVEVTECICTKLDLETIQVDVTVMTNEGKVRV